MCGWGYREYSDDGATFLRDRRAAEGRGLPAATCARCRVRIGEIHPRTWFTGAPIVADDGTAAFRPSPAVYCMECLPAPTFWNPQ